MNESARVVRTAALASASLMSAFTPAVSMPVYQEDDRLDVWQADEALARSRADSTLAIIASWKLAAGPNRVRIQSVPFGDTLGLCEGEPFRDQRAAVDCSGVLVGPDLVLTAAHCVASPITCKAHSFVFGFSIRERGGPTPASVPASEVYQCAELLGAVYHGENLTDWSVVRLDRPVANHRPLEIGRERVSAGTPLFVIGHPAGLPAKIAGNGRVMDDGPAEYFKTDLDTFDGNSGSPVFDAKTGKIVGVLARGEKDFETVTRPDGTQCLKTRRCTYEGCVGEGVTRISEFGHLIPELHRRDLQLDVSGSAALKSLKRMSGVDRD